MACTSTPVPCEIPEVVECRGERFRLFLDAATLQQRIAELGRQISQDYEGKRPILIGVLNGAFMFLADLMRYITIDCEVDFLKLSSYGAEKVSSGQVYELKKIDADIRGRHVLIVEDIVDTGLSMQFILERLKEYEPASVATVTLLHKAEATQVDVPLDYVGFRIPNKFVIGYGLDYGQLARNLASIYILDDNP
ncbi:hypoxanthine phosphoribosyltransferase [Rhodothermus marinus]|uniref:hypoxanthine phosphoribosyltransferase n=1 Tax=Rhodothermus marinus TaxID=29549 RepID=UPI0006D1203A|nr:hypoxanthine phosphoribosyltransferase [Rhodothermus marinus]